MPRNVRLARSNASCHVFQQQANGSFTGLHRTDLAFAAGVAKTPDHKENHNEAGLLCAKKAGKGFPAFALSNHEVYLRDADRFTSPFDVPCSLFFCLSGARAFTKTAKILHPPEIHFFLRAALVSPVYFSIKKNKQTGL